MGFQPLDEGVATQGRRSDSYPCAAIDTIRLEDTERTSTRYLCVPIITRRGEGILQKDEWKVEQALSDTFAALTKNRIYGNYYHKTAYWKLGAEYQNAEVVANALDVWGSG